MTEQPLTTSDILHEMWRLQDKVDKLLANLDDEVPDCANLFVRTGIYFQWQNRKRDRDGTVLMATPMVPNNSVAELYRAVANQPATPSAELFIAGVEVLMQETYPEEKEHDELETE